MRALANQEELNVGGQAVIEGVMMRAPRALAVAVRKASGEIAVKEDDWRSISERLRFLKWPGLRGSVVLIEALVNGLQALSFSAAQSGEEDEPPVSGWSITLAMLTGAGLAILLFVVVPHLLSGWLLATMGTGQGLQSGWFHLLDGVIKIALFLAYVWIISRFREIRRIFEYHGAEHKSIFCFEAGAELTIENARRFPRLHPRCGTSFIILVMLTSILLFSAAFAFLPAASGAASWQKLSLIGVKILLMFPVAGISYEIIRFGGKHMNWRWVKVIMAPGLALQRLTTAEPSDDQLEIALTALERAVALERAKRIPVI